MTVMNWENGKEASLSRVKTVSMNLLGSSHETTKN